MQVDFVDEFLRYTDHKPSQRIFLQWAAIALLSGAISRNVYTQSNGEPLRCNLYVVLVGPPASGKTIAINAARELVAVNWDHWIAPDSVTARSLTQLMSVGDEKNKEATEEKSYSDKDGQHWECRQVVMSREFGQFLNPQDTDKMRLLSEMFDCPPTYKHGTAHSGSDFLYNVYLVLLGGTTSAWVANLPSIAFEEGFMSRTIAVCGGELPPRPIVFGSQAPRESFERKHRLQALLEAAGTLTGEVEWSKAAQDAINEWKLADCPPLPSHPLLANFSGRRAMLVMKLAMLAAISRARSLSVTLADYQRAKGWLLEVEGLMPGIFDLVGRSPYHAVELEIAADIAAAFAETKTAIPEAAVLRAIARKVPSNLQRTVLETLIAQDRIRVADQCFAMHPRRLFVPGFAG